LRGLGVPLALYGYARGCGFDVAEVVRGEFYDVRPQVLFKTVQFSGAVNRHDPRFMGEEPCKSHLGRRRILPFLDAAEQPDDCLVGLAVFRGEAWDGVAKVGGVKRRCLVNLPVLTKNRFTASTLGFRSKMIAGGVMSVREEVTRLDGSSASVAR
jgi:hypothetical protein